MKLRINIHTLKTLISTDNNTTAEVKDTDADVHFDIISYDLQICRLNAPQRGWGMKIAAVTAAGFCMKRAIQTNKRKELLDNNKLQ